MTMTHGQRYKVYTKAADIVEHGWYKGGLTDDHGNYCLIGAVRRAVDDKRYVDRIRIPDELYSELRSSLGPGWAGVANHNHPVEVWNDMPWRRQATVVRKLRRLAARHSAAYIAELTTEITQLKTKLAAAEAIVAVAESRLKRYLTGKQKQQDFDTMLAYERVVQLEDELRSLSVSS